MSAPAISVLLTLVLCPLVLAGLRRWSLVDVPNARSSHVRPTPRGGGLAIVLGASTALVLSSSAAGSARTGLLLTAFVFGLIGLAEDTIGIPLPPRLALHVVAALVVLPWLLSPFSVGPAGLVLLGVVTVVWLVGYVNTFNFMDGINGISVAQVVVGGVALAIVGRVEDAQILTLGGLTVAAAALAFAPFNFPRARMFLGDVGSYFLGGWLGALAVYGIAAGIPPEAVLAPLALYVTDAAATLLMRMVRHEPWLSPHKAHVFQRLVQLGWSHVRTTLLVASLMVVLSGLGMVALDGLPARLGADILMAVVLSFYLLTPALVTRRGWGIAATARD